MNGEGRRKNLDDEYDAKVRPIVLMCSGVMNRRIFGGVAPD